MSAMAQPHKLIPLSGSVISQRISILHNQWHIQIHPRDRQYIYIYINSPRWASHPTLLGLRKEQLQHLIVASCINLLQQKPWSLVMKVHSSLPTTLLGQNRNRWSYGHGQWAIASPFCHAPNPKGSKAWERHLKVPVDFSFLTIQSTKSYQVPTSKIIIIIPLNILSK